MRAGQMMISGAKMPKYEVYKDSEVESLNTIPEHWALARFHDVFSFAKGLNITKENLQEDGIPCVNYGEIHSKYGFELNPEIHPLKCVDPKYLEKNQKSLLKYGDFIFADTSEDYDGSGNFTYLKSNKKIFAGYHTLICRLKNNVNERYLAYVLDSVSFRLQVRRAVKGVKVYSITQSILRSTKVWFANEFEQTLIANFLDQKTAQIDEAIAIKQQQISLLKERKQIIIQQAVTQGLDPNVPMKDSGIDWIGEIPEHWTTVKLKYATRLIQTGPFGTQLHAHDYVTSGIPLINPKHMIQGKIVPEKNCSVDVKTSVRLSRYALKIGDLILARRGELGRCAIVCENEAGWLCGTGSLMLRPDSSVFCIKYLSTLVSGNLVSEVLSLDSVGSTMDNLNTSILSNLPLPLPAIEEQLEIINYIYDVSGRIDEAVSMQALQIQKLKEYKTILINSAVTGKIKITPEMIGYV
ncbi:restriction endonuclease subunit S [Methylotuvimicrobium sp. KM1]|uniref:restriction endonuclease subunit S n=1 Tax=Methylotuvimicrobium sp. KM1 TaxID=3377707 RepID=UPI00384F6138